MARATIPTPRLVTNGRLGAPRPTDTSARSRPRRPFEKRSLTSSTEPRPDSPLRIAARARLLGRLITVIPFQSRHWDPPTPRERADSSLTRGIACVSITASTRFWMRKISTRSSAMAEQHQSRLSATHRQPPVPSTVDHPPRAPARVIRRFRTTHNLMERAGETPVRPRAQQFPSSSAATRRRPMRQPAVACSDEMDDPSYAHLVCHTHYRCLEHWTPCHVPGTNAPVDTRTIPIC